MAQAKKKRRTKHRGNAAGIVEARGRTGRKPDPVKDGKRSRGSLSAARNQARPPTWTGAAAKAAFGAAMLFVFVQLGVLGGDSSTRDALILCVFAMALYTPVMYATDRFIYQRKLRQQGKG